MADVIGLAADHGGQRLKHRIKELLESLGYKIKDFGVGDEETSSVDYPDYVGPLAQAISSGQIKRGVAVCGTGLGMCIVANRFPGVRATSVWDEYTAQVSRRHNNSNLICLGERVLNFERALDFLKIWLDTPFDKGRHERRLDKLKALELTVSQSKS